MNGPHDRAVAMWASSALTTANVQAAPNREFVRLLYQAGSPARLGDAARQAKQQTLDPDMRHSWILLGDPTLLAR